MAYLIFSTLHMQGQPPNTQNASSTSPRNQNLDVYPSLVLGHQQIIRIAPVLDPFLTLKSIISWNYP